MNDLSEKEQLEELQLWWRENRAWILGGVIIGIAILVGWRQWATGQVESAMEASGRYESLLEQVAANELEPAREIADTLFSDYDDTVYADQARLAMARLYMDRGRDADAAAVLRPLADAGDEPLAHIARLRLASILLYQDNPEAVLELLPAAPDSAFAARINELRGDAYHALGNFEAAAAAWSAVLADSRAQQTLDVNLVRMKLDDLPEPAAADGPAAGEQEDGGTE
ncbi:MAG: tetratricopeptide repeat protein [Woeseiaceae bacterium]|nr:tetratricopeptide repeat protein [Woeseiaceae bacterium]